LKDRARKIGTETFDKVQEYADTDSPQESEEKKMGMKERMKQMGVTPIIF